MKQAQRFIVRQLNCEALNSPHQKLPTDSLLACYLYSRSRKKFQGRDISYKILTLQANHNIIQNQVGQTIPVYKIYDYYPPNTLIYFEFILSINR